MPNRDGTGPMGQGSLTGRGFGNCVSKSVPFIAGAVAGLCLGLGRRNRQNRPRGRGFGFRNQEQPQDKQD